MSSNDLQETVGIIPCGATKIDGSAPARDLYTSSTFRSVLQAAESNFDRVLILSACYGLIDPDQVVDSYDLRMGDQGSVSSSTLQDQAVELRLTEADVYGLLPSTYMGALDEALRPLDIWVSPVFEATRGIGDQRSVSRIIR